MIVSGAQQRDWSNQSILKETNLEYSLEGLLLKLKLRYFGHMMRSADSLDKMEEKDDRGWDGWKASRTQWTWVWASSRKWWRTGKPGMLQSMWSKRVRHDWVAELNVDLLYSTGNSAQCNVAAWMGEEFGWKWIVAVVQCHIFWPFHTVHGVLKAKILKWLAIPFSGGPHFPPWPVCLGWPYMAWLKVSLS